MADPFAMESSDDDDFPFFHLLRLVEPPIIESEHSNNNTPLDIENLDSLDSQIEADIINNASDTLPKLWPQGYNGQLPKNSIIIKNEDFNPVDNNLDESAQNVIIKKKESVTPLSPNSLTRGIDWNNDNFESSKYIEIVFVRIKKKLFFFQFVLFQKMTFIDTFR